MADPDQWAGRGLGAAGRGPLQLSGRGIVGVQTDGMLAYRSRLTALDGDIAAVARRIRRLQQLPSGAGGPVGGDPLELLRARVHRLDTTVGVIAPLVGAAADGYAAAEDAAGRGLRGVAVVGVQVFGGAAARIAGLAALANAPLLLAGAAVAYAALPGRTPSEKSAAIGRSVKDNPAWVTSPELDEFVRFIGDNADDVTLGALGVPPAALALARAAGRGGVEDNARALVAVARPLGFFRETGVGVIPVKHGIAEGVAADRAVGPKERLLRIPDEGVVRIEKHTTPGQPPRYVVYVPPTETFSPEATTMPFDLTSNVGGVAGDSAGSVRAVELAMQHAGIGADDEVQLTGFSQGGLVAGRLAASGDWNVVGLETWGGPTRNIDLPSGIAGYDVHHSDDFVHALSGQQVPTDRLLVDQQARAGGFAADEKVVPAHQRDSYVDTATDLQRASSPQLTRELRRLDDFTGDYARQSGYRIETSEYDTYRADGGDVAPRPGWGSGVSASRAGGPSRAEG
ncbi:hypothetical protein [Schumannella sp. 10F1B-5-1]|uniref:hypothetical protein n=1 Tax=Schumannella sp. 10F1B-5-1 TaxID=2590780 RepID=UPI001131E780|nr:hypothetical protein [Schumannella sp. 10F1B-5-1]TPW76806.1 hypothetical protein FJ658_02375 [Schumannella sp. 10F1B-5-1]